MSNSAGWPPDPDQVGSGNTVTTKSIWIPFSVYLRVSPPPLQVFTRKVTVKCCQEIFLNIAIIPPNNAKPLILWELERQIFKRLRLTDLFVCTPWRHWGNGGILKLKIKWRWVGSIMSRPLYLWGESCHYFSKRGLRGFQMQSEKIGDLTNILPVPEIKPKSFGCPTNTLCLVDDKWCVRKAWLKVMSFCLWDFRFKSRPSKGLFWRIFRPFILCGSITHKTYSF